MRRLILEDVYLLREGDEVMISAADSNSQFIVIRERILAHFEDMAGYHVFKAQPHYKPGEGALLGYSVFFEENLAVGVPYEFLKADDNLEKILQERKEAAQKKD